MSSATYHANSTLAYDEPPPGVLDRIENRSRIWADASLLFEDFDEQLGKGAISRPYTLAEFQGLELAPGQICTIGAPPATGKTCAAMQVVFEVLSLNPRVDAFIMNGESSFAAIAMRELSRRSGVSTRRMRLGTMSEADRVEIERVKPSMLSDLQRVRWLGADATITEALLKLRDEEPGLLVVDYLQKLCPSSGDAKQGIQEMLNDLRSLCHADWAVLVLSATNRASASFKDKQKAAMQAGFRDSSEIEFQSDAAYIITIDEGQDEDEPSPIMTFACVKNRWDMQQDLQLRFIKQEQRFERVNVYIDDFVSSFNAPNLDDSNPFG